MASKKDKTLWYIAYAATGLCALVVGVYLILVWRIGGIPYSSDPSAWANFATYFGNMTTPFVTVGSIAIAYLGLKKQILIEADNQRINAINALYESIDCLISSLDDSLCNLTASAIEKAYISRNEDNDSTFALYIEQVIIICNTLDIISYLRDHSNFDNNLASATAAARLSAACNKIRPTLRTVILNIDYTNKLRTEFTEVPSYLNDSQVEKRRSELKKTSEIEKIMPGINK